MDIVYHTFILTSKLEFQLYNCIIVITIEQDEKEKISMDRMNDMERKVTKFGNSLGITMTDALKQIGLDQGDIVNIAVNPESGEIIIKKSTKISLPEGVSSDFMSTLTDVIEEYDQTLKGLKDR